MKDVKIPRGSIREKTLISVFNRWHFKTHISYNIMLELLARLNMADLILCYYNVL